MKRQIAAVAAAMALMPALCLQGASAGERDVMVAQRAESGSVRQRLEENSHRNRHDHRPPRHAAPRNQLVDCHRDIRTHWIGGSIVTHRHVGEDCQVRIVNQGTAAPPPGSRD